MSYLDSLPERPSGNVLGIDIGFNTIIFTLFSPQRKQIIHGKTLNKRGVHDPQIMNYQKRQQLPWISAYQDGFCWTSGKRKSLDFSRLLVFAGLVRTYNWCGGMESNHHGVAPASPSSWCVYQFRHHRKQSTHKNCAHLNSWRKLYYC